MNSASSFANLVADQYGLDDVPSSAAGARASLGMARVRYELPHLFVLPPLPREDAFVVSVELASAGSRRMFGDHCLSAVAPMPAGAVQITDLTNQPISYVCSPFSSLLFHTTRTTLNEFAQEAGLQRVERLHCMPGTTDPVLAGLAHAVLPSLMKPQEQSTLFLDHVALALYAHLAHTYGGVGDASQRQVGGLAPWQERTAKDLLTASLARNLSLAEVAQACRLSRGHFTKAFKQTTGQTPHAWLVARRIDAAKRHLLGSTQSLSEIALACGFADQSHLTRVFGQHVGQAPGQWRKARLH